VPPRKIFAPFPSFFVPIPLLRFLRLSTLHFLLRAASLSSPLASRRGRDLVPQTLSVRLPTLPLRNRTKYLPAQPSGRRGVKGHPPDYQSTPFVLQDVPVPSLYTLSALNSPSDPEFSPPCTFIRIGPAITTPFLPCSFSPIDLGSSGQFFFQLSLLLDLRLLPRFFA